MNRYIFTVERGLALGVILATLLLSATLGMAVAYSVRTGTMTDQTQSDRTIATALVQQAANIKSAWQLALDRGVSAKQITLSTTTTTGLYDPAGVNLPVQTPPRNALTDSDSNVANDIWTLQVDSSGNPMVKLNGVGTTAAEYMIAVGPLTQKVCIEINRIVAGQSTSPGGNAAEGSFSNWMNRPSSTFIDMSADADMTQPEQCVGTADGYGIYYVTLQAG